MQLQKLTETLPGQLERAPSHTGESDVRELLECRFFDPCDATWDEYDNFS